MYFGGDQAMRFNCILRDLWKKLWETETVSQDTLKNTVCV